jgi:general secretion pathway protein A
MLKEMLSYFNMTGLPFDREIPSDQLILLPTFKEALSSLNLLVTTRGIGVMTGKSGTGKSCVIRMLIAHLNKGLYKPLYVCHTTVSALEFYSHIASEMGLVCSSRKAAAFRAVKERVFSLNKTSRVHPVLIIDEAHLLRNEILTELRLLTNFEIDSYSALTILLCAQESLRPKFGLTILESLANSITINVALDGLREEETYSYIEQRIKAMGAGKPLFTKPAMRIIHQSSGGIIRGVNNIAMACLYKVFNEKAQMVEAEHVTMVISR